MRNASEHGQLDRREFVSTLLAQCPDALVVTGLGSPSYDVFAAGDRPGNFYLWGAMGGAASVGLGLALAQPEKSVIVVTGDGEQLMGIGSLATVAVQRPPNLTLVVLDNGHFGETGMQRSHTSLGTNIATVAKGCGLVQVMEIRDMESVGLLVELVHARKGPTLAQVQIRSEELPRALPPRDGVFVKNRFRMHLGFEPM
jgi:thiamine pyrophosphate-dependent acetolactate synthase large subunit-like protein